MNPNITLRPVTPADMQEIGRIVFEAFKTSANEHLFPLDFPTPERAMGLASMFIEHPGIYGVVAESNGKIIGSNFLDERSPMRGVGPITVDPSFHGKGAGRMLMQAVIDRGRGARGIRLLQDAFNTVSMPLYASVGFDIKEPIVLMNGRPKGSPSSGTEVRPLSDADLPACAELCQKVHGHDRNGELKDAIKMFGAMGLFRAGRLSAYMSAPPLWPLNHGVGQTEQDLTDLIVSAGAKLPEPFSVLIPTRRASLFRWCLKAGLRVVKPMSLMAIGEYHEPAGAFFPSVLY